MDTPTETKLCTGCREVKPVTEYYRRSASKDGVQPRCKPCKDKQTRAWQKKNPTRVAASNRRWREANKDKVRASHTKYYQANREKYIATAKAWNAAHPERAKEAQRRYNERKKLRRAAEKKGALK